MAARRVMAQMRLVNMPLRLEKATDDEDAGLHTICIGDGDKPHDPERVKQSVACPVCGKAASSHYGFPNRGAMNDSGEMVVVTAEQLQEAKGTPVTGKPDCPVIIRFTSREKIYASTVPAGSVNNLTPDKGGEKPYAALVQHLENHPEKVAVFKWAPRTNNAWWIVEAVDGRLVAMAMTPPELVRPVPAVAPVEVTDAETAMFDQLAEDLTEDFDPTAYADTAAQGLRELLAAQAGQVVRSAVAGTGDDMLAALTASLEAAKPVAKKKATKKTTVPRQRKSA